MEIIKDKTDINDDNLHLRSFMGNLTAIINHLEAVNDTIKHFARMTDQLEADLKPLARKISYIVGQCTSTLCLAVLMNSMSYATVDYSVVNVTKSLTILRDIQQSEDDLDSTKNAVRNP